MGNYDVDIEIRPFYEHQIRTGEYKNFGGRTNVAMVCDLLSSINVSGKTIFDLGCGDGNVAQAIRKNIGKWKHYIGIEVMQKLIDQCKARQLEGTDIRMGDARELSHFTTASVDLILSLFFYRICPRVREKILSKRSLAL